MCVCVVGDQVCGNCMCNHMCRGLSLWVHTGKDMLHILSFFSSVCVFTCVCVHMHALVVSQ